MGKLIRPEDIADTILFLASEKAGMLTVREHIDLLKSTGFIDVHVFWYRYMQMGVYAFKRLQK